MMKRLINQKAFFEAMKRGILTAVIIIVLVAAAAIFYFINQPKLSEAAIKECENAIDKAKCISEEKAILKCQQKASPDEKGMAELKKCIESVTGPMEAPVNCAEQPDLLECQKVGECTNSENPAECLRQAGNVPVIIETSS
jgi:hypothetical protein